MTTFTFILRTPEENVFEGEVRAVNCPAAAGRLGVLPSMAPRLEQLTSGVLTADLSDGVRLNWKIKGGLIHIEPIKVVALVQQIEQ